MKLAMFLIVGIATTAFAASGLDHLPRSPIGQHALPILRNQNHRREQQRRDTNDAL